MLKICQKGVDQNKVTFARLPNVVREVAHESLQEEDKADPLVPRVPDLIPILGHPDQVRVVGIQIGLEVVHGGNSWVRYLCANFSGDLGGDGKGPVDPTVGVHDA